VFRCPRRCAIPRPGPASPQPISFGRRADADIKPVTITPKSIRGYKLPSSSLLYRSDETPIVREQALRDEARTLVQKCAEFGVDGQVTQINPGPVVTTFEFRPDAGVKYSRVTSLADDLCLAMAAESILIERMAGKSTVGIQVPNLGRETIWLRDVVECESFAQSKSKLAIALGKDINGRIVTADLAAMPHILIAGSTGSGKSVAINAMIMSVLFKSTPEQVRMILVDPKRVELGMYEGIPHLFTPIITEAKLAANALRNAVREMERRLKLLAANHVRNIDQFNKLFDNGSEYLFDDADQEPLPYIIIIIDELADLMMLDRANVEESITRLAQMARAVGIHLVLATQRPSVDVITGLIKANIPTRISFRLATKVDSRTIIDSNGAESLLGKGDMLYLAPGTSRVHRLHAPFVTEKEISAVTAFWKAQGEAEYVHGFLEGPKDEAGKDIDPNAEASQEERRSLRRRRPPGLRVRQGQHQPAAAPPAHRLRPRRPPHRHDGARRPGRSRRRLQAPRNPKSPHLLQRSRRRPPLSPRVEEFAGCHNLSARPGVRKVSCVSGDDVLGLGGLRTFKEDVVVRIGAGADPFDRLDPETLFADREEDGLNLALASMEVWAADDVFVLGIDGPTYAELKIGMQKGHQEYLRGSAFQSQRGGDQDVGVEDDPDGHSGLLLHGLTVAPGFAGGGDLRIDLFRGQIVQAQLSRAFP
jgi:hypothetical protein